MPVHCTRRTLPGRSTRYTVNGLRADTFAGPTKGGYGTFRKLITRVPVFLYLFILKKRAHKALEFLHRELKKASRYSTPE